MKRFALYLALVFIALMVSAPLFTLKESLSTDKLRDRTAGEIIKGHGGEFL